MTSTVPEIETFVFEDAEFDICCDIPALMEKFGRHFPTCGGDPAVWVGWRPGCCGKGPRYRLLCDSCKKRYELWVRVHAHITCTYCGAETGGFVAYTPLNKGKA